MGSDDVKLKYSDDDPDSYSNIFDNAKTDPDTADKARLIASIKQMNEQTDLEEVVDIEEVIRYFVVHDFVVNGDSYTGSMVHNYYLHEENGVLQMIPWDYNLAYGTFQGNNASSAVNDPIDTPVSSSGGMGGGMGGGFGRHGDRMGNTTGGSMEAASGSMEPPDGMPEMEATPENTDFPEGESAPTGGASDASGEESEETDPDDQSDRPMVAWVVEIPEYRELYHQYFQEFLDTTDILTKIQETAALIAPYVERDPTAFCTYEEFETAVEAITRFVELRMESVQGQLNGTIPSTTSGQSEDGAVLVDASGLELSDMGTMNNGGMGGGQGGPGNMGGPGAASGGGIQMGPGQ